MIETHEKKADDVKVEDVADVADMLNHVVFSEIPE